MKPNDLAGVNLGKMTDLTSATSAEVHLVCSCANSADHEGFYPCDTDGHPARNGVLACCDRCGKILNPETGEVVGRRSFALSAPLDEFF